MLLAGLDWRTLPPARLVNVLSALILREYSYDPKAVHIREKLRLEFEDPEYREQIEAIREAEAYDSRLDESGLPAGLTEAPRG